MSNWQKSNNVISSLYVNELIVTEIDVNVIEDFKIEMKREFEMKNIGLMTFFLCMEIKQKEKGVFIKQKKYVKEILKKFKMESCKEMSTPTN